jgi:hypothetical protein
VATATPLLLRRADQLLRPGRARLEFPPRTLLALIVLFGLVYGAMMGLFNAPGEPPRALQSLYSSVKVPMLLLLTFALALPSFYVLNMLLGVAGDFREALRALLATQAGLTVVLASLGPFTLVFYASTTNYDAAILFNAAMFGAASLAAQRLLKRFYAPLILRNPRHRTLVRVWILLYAFIGIQMGWVLRPFIGHPDSDTTFFRAGAWGNAYVEVWDKVVDVAGGGRARR